MTCRFATGSKKFWISILMQDELEAKPASFYVPGHCVKKLSQDACPQWKTTAFRGPQCSTATNSQWTTTCASLRSQTRMGLGLVREYQSPYRPATGQGVKPEKNKVRLFQEGLFFSYLFYTYHRLSWGPGVWRADRGFGDPWVGFKGVKKS